MSLLFAACAIVIGYIMIGAVVYVAVKVITSIFDGETLPDELDTDDVWIMWLWPLVFFVMIGVGVPWLITIGVHKVAVLVCNHFDGGSDGT